MIYLRAKAFSCEKGSSLLPALPYKFIEINKLRMIVTRPAILERPVDDVTRERPKSYRVRRAGFVLVLLDVEPPDEQVVPRLAPIPPAGIGER